MTLNPTEYADWLSRVVSVIAVGWSFIKIFLRGDASQAERLFSFLRNLLTTTDWLHSNDGRVLMYNGKTVPENDLLCPTCGAPVEPIVVVYPEGEPWPVVYLNKGGSYLNEEKVMHLFNWRQRWLLRRKARKLVKQAEKNKLKNRLGKILESIKNDEIH